MDPPASDLQAFFAAVRARSNLVDAGHMRATRHGRSFDRAALRGASRVGATVCTLRAARTGVGFARLVRFCCKRRTALQRAGSHHDSASFARKRQ
jgi:hypothetical protein